MCFLGCDLNRSRWSVDQVSMGLAAGLGWAAAAGPQGEHEALPAYPSALILEKSRGVAHRGLHGESNAASCRRLAELDDESFKSNTSNAAVIKRSQVNLRREALTSPDEALMSPTVH
jgi:hypothetical protein